MTVREAGYDVTELSVSSCAPQVSQGESADTAIPAFVSRAFRHSGFHARAGAGVESPADLQGRRVGVPEYQMTAALWMRGLMKDEFGVRAEDVHWRTGALNPGVRRERLALTLPKGMVIEPIKDGETLQDLLLAGGIDGLLAPTPARAFLEGDMRILRLFPDVGAAERDYHARTGFFPIMHLIAVRLGARRLSYAARRLGAVHLGLRDATAPRRLRARRACAGPVPRARRRRRRSEWPRSRPSRTGACRSAASPRDGRTAMRARSARAAARPVLFGFSDDGVAHLADVETGEPRRPVDRLGKRLRIHRRDGPGPSPSIAFGEKARHRLQTVETVRPYHSAQVERAVRIA